MGKIIRRSIAFEQVDEEIVSQLRKQLGISRSAAVRLILRDWKGEHDRYVITDKGRQAINNKVLDSGQS